MLGRIFLAFSYETSRKLFLPIVEMDCLSTLGAVRRVPHQPYDADMLAVAC